MGLLGPEVQILSARPRSAAGLHQADQRLGTGAQATSTANVSPWSSHSYSHARVTNLCLWLPRVRGALLRAATRHQRSALIEAAHAASRRGRRHWPFVMPSIRSTRTPGRLCRARTFCARSIPEAKQKGEAVGLPLYSNGGYSLDFVGAHLTGRSPLCMCRCPASSRSCRWQ